MIEALFIVTVFAGAWFSHQYGWWRHTIDYAHPRILMYHMVAHHKPGARFNKLRVEPEEFEKQIAWLYQHGWTFIFMSELGIGDPYKTVALTFDDGYRDNFLNALPVLQKYRAKATLYLVADRHDRDWSKSKKRHHDDGELVEEPKLLDDDVNAMLRSGHWELAAHSTTHANLLDADNEVRVREIRDSKTMLEQRFGVDICSFAYPFGLFRGTDVKEVRDAGYVNAVTTVQGVSDNVKNEGLVLRRVKVSGNDGMYAFRLRLRTGKCRLRD